MLQNVPGICWPHGGTVGHASVTGNRISGDFASTEGDDAQVACGFVAAGKYRNGAARAWCRTHQQYWGVKADLAGQGEVGAQRCARHAEPMGYVLDPLVFDLAHHAQLTFGRAEDGALLVSALPAAPGAPAFHGHCKAFALVARACFSGADIVQLNITPVLIHAWHSAVRSGLPIGCIACARCGHPHLDLGGFSVREHRRHYCGNCGYDATHSPHAMISNPLFSLLNFYGARLRIVDPV